jgi:DNA-binding GntR family transcriptional regulator
MSPAGNGGSHKTAPQVERGARPLAAYMQLRELIVRGTIAPGAPLIETELADHLNVSRTPIRDALQRLRQEGLITDAGERRVFKFVVAPLTRSDAQSLFYIMGELEGLAAHGAALLPATQRRGLAAALKDVNRDLRALARGSETDAHEFFGLDRAFHRLTSGAASNPRLHSLHATVEPQVERYWRVYAVVRVDAVASSAGEHDAVIKAIARGDADGAHLAIRANWRNSAERLRPAIESLGERGSW